MVEVLGAGFGQPIGQRLEHDRRIVVVGGLERRGPITHPFACRDDEGTDVVFGASALRCDEVGERPVRTIVGVAHLLAQRVQPRCFCCAGMIAVHGDVVADRRWPARTHDRFGREPLLGDDLVEHLLAIGVELPSDRSDHVVVENLRVGADQVPGPEKRRPVDEVAQICRA